MGSPPIQGNYPDTCHAEGGEIPVRILDCTAQTLRSKHVRTLRQCTELECLGSSGHVRSSVPVNCPCQCCLKSRSGNSEREPQNHLQKLDCLTTHLGLVSSMEALKIISSLRLQHQVSTTTPNLYMCSALGQDSSV